MIKLMVAVAALAVALSSVVSMFWVGVDVHMVEGFGKSFVAWAAVFAITSVGGLMLAGCMIVYIIELFKGD